METTAADMARAAGVDPKIYRAALRRADLYWHAEGAAWTVLIGSDRHKEMEAVLGRLTNARRGVRAALPRVAANASPTKEPAAFHRLGRGRAHSDEAYVLDHCDAILGEAARRQHRFDFLLGDPGKDGRHRRLPVDAWYSGHNLVVEYRERQHSEAVRFFDRRQTVSGVGRGEQRALYDARRRVVLAEQGIRLVEIDYSHFSFDRAKRIIRQARDRVIIAGLLQNQTEAL